jgi:hypothetical protein
VGTKCVSPEDKDIVDSRSVSTHFKCLPFYLVPNLLTTNALQAQLTQDIKVITNVFPEVCP